MKESIRILVVEDDSRKANLISRLLCDIPSVTESSIVHVGSVIEAKKIIASEAFDLLLLDIHLPWRSGERPEPDGGLKLWQTVRSRPDYKRPAHVIGMTAYEETRRDLGTVMEEENWLLIQYSDSSSGWRDQVIQKVEHILTLKGQAEADEGKFLTSVVIITATDIERDAIRDLPYSWICDQSPVGGALLFRGTYPQNGGGDGKLIVVTAHQMGMPAAACVTFTAISEFRPRYVIMSGIAAGVRGKVNLGDILVADPSWDWGSGKLALEKGNRIFQPDPRPLRVEPELVGTCLKIAADEATLTKIRNEWKGDKPNTILRLHVGPVASGAPVVCDPSIVDEIKANSRKLIGVDMETYGVYYASYVAPRPKPKTMSIKAVCDFADADKDDRFQRYAAYTSASVVKELLERQLTFGR
jgi:nucleoside phosphorylase